MSANPENSSTCAESQRLLLTEQPFTDNDQDKSFKSEEDLEILFSNERCSRELRINFY
jgi:hypothetical protein